MPDPLVPVAMDDFDALWGLYADICAQQPYDTYGAQWQMGIYPAREDLVTHIEANEMYAIWHEGRLVAAMAVVPHEDPAYASIPWPCACAPDQVAVVHLLGVHPSMRGKHLGARMAREALNVARSLDKRAVHLDVVPSNVAASRIYVEAGFTFVGTYQVYYVDTGLTDYNMYEYVL